ncbi:MAG TPA: DUF433 domain-containing protein [Gemmataceae bacterium]|jgi:uncharacterized protein (DUF433 family)|nr:DUF433 domain-containing protein [Gemmataceae bacterium]
MQLEDYFQRNPIETKYGPTEQIRIKGTRVSIEHVLNPYLQGDSPERIYHGFRHSLTLEQVYATITFYLNRKSEIDQYLAEGKRIEDLMYQEYLAEEPTGVAARLRKLAEERDKLRAGVKSE